MPPKGKIVTKDDPLVIGGKEYYTYFKIDGTEIDIGSTVKTYKGAKLEIRIWCINKGDQEGYFELRLSDILNNEVLLEKHMICSPGGNGFWYFYRENIEKDRSLKVTLDTYYYTGDFTNPKGKYVCTDEIPTVTIIILKKATLNISTNPSGANVYVDGKYMGKT